MTQRFLALLLAALPLAAAGANGAPTDGTVSLSGFATLGLARSNTDDAQFVRYNQAEGVASGFGSGTDSNLGLQLSVAFNPTLSATAQVLTRKYTSPRYTTDLSWAFLKLQLRPDLALRAGRVVVPSFMISDYQNVGYANTMMRPPLEMYGLAAIEHIDGADLSYQRSFGAYTVTAQLAAGVSHGKLFVAGGGGSIATIRAPLYTLNLALENGPYMLRLSHLATELESRDFAALNGVTAGLAQAGLTQLARDLTLVGGKRISFSSIGATMDRNNVLLQAEYGRRHANEPVYIPNNNAYYLMAGYRIGALLPYYAHAAVWQAGRSVTLPADAGAAAALVQRVDRGFLTAAEQHSDLVGLRWNFAKARALKVQIDRVRPTRKSGGLIAGPADGLKRPVVVLAFALDAVF